MRRHDVWIGVFARQLVQCGTLRQRYAFLAVAARIRDRLGPFAEPARIAFRRALRDISRNRGALLKVEVRVLSDLGLLCQPAPPALEVIDPCRHRIKVAAKELDSEARCPPVVARGCHRHALPVGCAFVPVEKSGGDRVMAVGEHVCCNRDGFTDHALHGKLPAVHLRCDLFNDDSNPAHC